ncbi:FecCD family ABC transporter permease [Fimbriimonas ginsengisoli]|uniref:Hemin ABC transporter, permease protein n=1 Tax=Fimbriimonas ginsengisoli Gsoil 348 TaxID=661478 RepID=A0A068NVC1_FIMGI|nr:iron ABC transporter permease [Fimbriimonas ginsengisoli]AIE85519.1 Hemin ABC transporter, permease protein [Fimbriimonas ginsengisoli Gsoil 348]
MTPQNGARHRPGRTLIVLACVVVLLFLVHVGIGTHEWYTPWKILGEIFRGPGGEEASVVVWQNRLPRACMCFFVGAILGVVGSAFQAQFRNPLADPFIVGVSSGSAIGGVVALLVGIGAWMGGLGTALFGFVGGMLSLALVLALARRRGVIDVTSLLLAGVVLGSFLSSVLTLTLLLAGKDTNRVLTWLSGSLSESFWSKVYLLAAAFAAGTVILVRQSRLLNALALGEEEAARLGVDPVRLRNIVLTTGTAMTAAAVGSVGIIGFVGLVSAHISRRLIGVDWRWSLTGAGLVGAGLLLASDLIAQRALSVLTQTIGFDVPVGIVTAILGAPVLLVLLRRKP